MTEKPYIMWSSKTDSSIEQDIGLFIRNARQKQRKTQAELAKEADISRSTLSLLERGEAGTITTLIKVLRVLDQLQAMRGFEIENTISPLALAKMQTKERQRVRKPKKGEGKSSSW